jgi:FkbM family methyltransferase
MKGALSMTRPRHFDQRGFEYRLSRVPRLAMLIVFSAIALLVGPARLHAESADVAKPSAVAEPTGDAVLTEGKKLYSQHNEELVIRHFFQDRRDGFFVDVGSYHWKNASTTLYLERHLGWSGIAIDAQRGFAQGYKKNRPATRFVSYLVTDKSGDTGTIYQAGALTSANPHHLDLFKADPVTFPGASKLEGKPVEVPTITLNDLLAKHGVEKIDFLSMDIEGSEPAALAGFDIERYRPELVCIEVGGQASAKIAPYFEKHGYRRIGEYARHDRVNWYYTPVSDEAESADESANAESAQE